MLSYEQLQGLEVACNIVNRKNQACLKTIFTMGSLAAESRPG